MKMLFPEGPGPQALPNYALLARMTVKPGKQFTSARRSGTVAENFHVNPS
jgi:hypothetical protein